MRWKDVSEKSREIMEKLGGYAPSQTRKDARVVGWVCDDESAYGVEKVYWSSENLRDIATACIEVADWLDKRAAEAKGE